MTITMQEFVESQGLTMNCHRADSNPNMPDSENMDHWNCHIFFADGQVWVVPFSMGADHNGAAPALIDVLDCLASDAAGYENSENFEDWAPEYGYDPDSRNAERIYNCVADQVETMKEHFTPEAYEQLLWNTERL